MSALPELLQTLHDTLQALQRAVREGDAEAVEAHTQAIAQGLQEAAVQFQRAQQHGPLPAPWRDQVQQLHTQVQAQREALARAQASVDRSLGILLPSTRQAGVYGGGSASPIAGVPLGQHHTQA